MARRNPKQSASKESVADAAADVAVIPVSDAKGPMLDGVLMVARSAAEILENGIEGTLLLKSPYARTLFELKLSPTDRKTLCQLDVFNPSLLDRLRRPATREPTLWFTFHELSELALAIADAVRVEEQPDKKLLDVGRKLLTRIRSALQEADVDGELAKRREFVRQGVYQLRIALADIKPEIWRRMQVEDCTLLDLHDLIQAVMGWDGDHLFEFRIKGRSIGHPDSDGDDASSIQLSDLIDRKGFKFQYVYDFGDNWTHEIEVEDILSREPGRAYPTCLAGEMACPPEDVGGAWGYMELVDSLKDGNPGEGFEGWEGLEEFDPDQFDRDAVNEWFSKARDFRNGEDDDADADEME